MDPLEKPQVDALSWSPEEFGRYWKIVPNKEVFFALLAAWVLLFHWFGNSQFNFTTSSSLFQWLWGAWSAEALDSSHGKIIPVAVLVILWVKREEIMGAIGEIWWPGLIGVALALVLHMIGFIIEQPRLSVFSLFFGFYSLVGLTWGKRLLRVSFFPFVLFAFCMPLGTFVEGLTFSLRLLSTGITWFIAKSIMGIPVIQRGTQLIDVNHTFNYDVGAACSGIRSMFALLAITTIFGMLLFRSYWRRGMMIFLAIPLSIFCNVLRLLAIILAAQAFGQNAGNVVHDYFGYVTYAIAIAATFTVAHFLREKPRSSVV